ncbi:MAG: N-acetyltransferase [Desulfobulbaceae bacterium]|nr:N-acetyltransferase [Desulfobulbaceae bacterium]
MSMKDQKQLGENVTVQQGAIVGYRYKDGCGPVLIGENSVIRAGTIIYSDVKAGDNFQTGHNAVIREKTSMGRYVLIGSGTIMDGNVDIADFVKIESNCYVCTYVTIGTRVFIGPNVVFTNDQYPLKMRDAYKPEGPIIDDLVTIGAGSVILPGVRIGRGSFVAAGTVVTKSVPPMTFVRGNPGRHSELPEYLREKNIALNWRKVINE